MRSLVFHIYFHNHIPMGFEGPSAKDVASDARTGLFVAWGVALFGLIATNIIYFMYRKELHVSSRTVKRVAFERIIRLPLVMAWVSTLSLIGLRSALVWEVVLTIQKAISLRAMVTLIMSYCDENPTKLNELTNGKGWLYIKLMTSFQYLTVVGVGILIAVIMGLSSETGNHIFGIAMPVCTIPCTVAMMRIYKKLSKTLESEFESDGFAGKVKALRLPIMLSAVQGLLFTILAANDKLPSGEGSLADKENMQSAITFFALSIEAPFMMLYAIKNYPADQLDGEEAIPQRLDASAPSCV